MHDSVEIASAYLLTIYIFMILILNIILRNIPPLYHYLRKRVIFYHGKLENCHKKLRVNNN